MKCKGYLLSVSIGLAMLLSGSTAVALAEPEPPRTMVPYRHLSPLTEDLSTPTAVASDGNGLIYVVEPARDRLFQYDAEGTLLRTRGGLLQPISVAVGSDHMVFVGSGSVGSVDALGVEDLRQAFQLGVGRGEFGRPTGLAVSADGTIFVADHEAHQIKVYGADGVQMYAFGAPGRGDGTLNFPLSLAFDAAADEIYVVDRLSTHVSMGDQTGNRIQVFTRDGMFKRRFGEVGMGPGRLARPVGIQADGSGRAYISDALQNVVQVFAADGFYLGSLFDPADPMRTPLGVAFDFSARRVLVASQNTRKVQRFQLVSEGFRVAVLVQGEGAVEPPGPVTVEEGGNVDFRFAPAAGYFLKKVTVDGAGVAVDGLTYTLPAVAFDCVLTVVFADEIPPEPVVWTVNVTSGPGGSVVPAGDLAVLDGGALALTITPESGVSLAELRLDGVPVAELPEAVYRLENVVANHTVDVRFETIPFSGGGGSGGGGEPSSDPVAGPVVDPLPEPDPVPDPARDPVTDPDSYPVAEVIDSATGLVWAGESCGGEGTWHQALTFVAELNGGQYPDCGAEHTNWRLPTAREVESLAALCRDGSAAAGPCADTEGAVWSSTTYAAEPAQAWALDPVQRLLTARTKSEPALVWPVRSRQGQTPTTWKTGQTLCYDEAGAEVACEGTGQDGELQAGAPWPDPRFTDNGEGTTTDRLTGLSWLNDEGCLRADELLSFNHDPVPYACREYVGRYADWRVPSLAELSAMIDFSGDLGILLADEAVWPLLGTAGEGTEEVVWSPAGGRVAASEVQAARLWPVREGAPDTAPAPEPPADPTAEPPVDPTPPVAGAGGGEGARDTSGGAGGGQCFLGATTPDLGVRWSAVWKRLCGGDEGCRWEAFWNRRAMGHPSREEQ